MMLDAKRTFDELVDSYAPDEETRDAVLANPIYQQLSNAVAGSQEYMAMEKLHELHQEGNYDLLVLDTPPTRNALDFLDAPRRLARFIDSRSLSFFRASSKLGFGLLGRGSGMVFSVMKRATGVDLLKDLADFFNSFGDMADGFRERAERVNALIADRRTTFLLVTSPRAASIEEAGYFHRKLRNEDLPFGGVIVNRMREPVRAKPGPKLEEELTGLLDDKLAGKVARTLDEHRSLAERDAANVDQPAVEAGPQADDHRARAARRRARPRRPAGDERVPVRQVSDQAGKAERFAALHESGTFVMPNPWDAGSAKVLESLGFEALATTSSGFAHTLGREDGEVTLDEVTAHVAALDAATSLPLSVDLENGYGPAPADAATAIVRAAGAGAVGGSIEDWARGGHLYEPEARSRARGGGRRGGTRAVLPVHAHGPRREPHPRQPRPGRHDRAPAGLRGGGRGRALRAGAEERRGDPGRVRVGVAPGERARAARPDPRGDRRRGRRAG